MEFSEKELEDWLYENPDEVGVEYWIGRQLSLPSGILDLVGVQDPRYPSNLIVIELKAVPLSSSSVLQVCRYAADLSMLPGVDDVEKMCIGVGSVSNELLRGANAVDVSLKSVEPSFSISGRWRFSEDRINEDRDTLLKAIAGNRWLRQMCLISDTKNSLLSAAKSSSISESLLRDMSSDYRFDVDYWLRNRVDVAAVPA